MLQKPEYLIEAEKEYDQISQSYRRGDINNAELLRAQSRMERVRARWDREFSEASSKTKGS